MPRVLHLNASAPGVEPVGEAVTALVRGELVILPTDTVYGLCAHPGQATAVEAIYRLKQRRRDKPLAWLASNLQQIRDVGAEVCDRAEAIADAFWPGGLTLVLRVGEGTIGFRIPDHPVPLAVMEQLNSPLIATSVNLSGEPPATSAESAMAVCGDDVAVVLDDGEVSGGVASTVVSVLDGEVRVLREGAIGAELVGSVHA